MSTEQMCFLTKKQIYKRCSRRPVLPYLGPGYKE